jgi:hypothetical protein
MTTDSVVSFHSNLPSIALPLVLGSARVAVCVVFIKVKLSWGPLCLDLVGYIYVIFTGF